MYGCCYGPYNLRNEIDRHNNTVGGHNSNTHFVTGEASESPLLPPLPPTWPANRTAQARLVFRFLSAPIGLRSLEFGSTKQAACVC